MKNLFFGIAVLSVFGLASAASCTDETGGDGGSGGTSDGGNGTGATGGGTGGTGGSTSSCASCLDYVNGQLSGTPIDATTMCGYADDPTDPTSSFGLLIALGECTCDPEFGNCAADCAETCTDTGTDTANCGTCQQDAAIGGPCNPEFNACSGDVDGTGE